jgi:hypothetical protein
VPRRLDLSDKGVELMAYLSMHSGTDEEQIARALWPRKKLDRALELLEETANEVNAVVARTTGNPTPVIATPDHPIPPAAKHPKVFVHIFGRPYAEVYDDDEPFPGE